jgi:hypothetical protein
MLDDEGERAGRQQHAGIAERQDQAGPQSELHRRELLGRQCHRAHQHAGCRHPDQRLGQEETDRAARCRGQRRAGDRSGKQRQRHRADAVAIERDADGNLQQREKEMIGGCQRRQRLRGGVKIDRHQIDRHRRRRAQQVGQHMAAGEDHQRGHQRRADPRGHEFGIEFGIE